MRAVKFVELARGIHKERAHIPYRIETVKEMDRRIKRIRGEKG